MTKNEESVLRQIKEDVKQAYFASTREGSDLHLKSASARIDVLLSLMVQEDKKDNEPYSTGEA